MAQYNYIKYSVGKTYGNFDIRPETFRFDKAENCCYFTLRHKNKSYDCPFCSEPTSSVHQVHYRTIKDYLFDTKIEVRFESRKFRCLKCGRIFTESVPFTVGKSPFSIRILYIMKLRLEGKNLTIVDYPVDRLNTWSINKNTFKTLIRNKYYDQLLSQALDDSVLFQGFEGVFPFSKKSKYTDGSRFLVPLDPAILDSEMIIYLKSRKRDDLLDVRWTTADHA